MKIHLLKLQEDVPTPVASEYDPKHLDLEFVDLVYDSPLNLKGTVEKFSDSLVFRGNLEGKIAHVCGRCLKHVPDHLSRSFEFFYETKDKEVIDTTGDLRDLLILDHPIQFVCRNDCNGLCPSCGVDLNSESCRCHAKEKSSPFLVLKNFPVRKA